VESAVRGLSCVLVFAFVLESTWEDSPVLLVLIASAVLAAVIGVFGLIGVVDLYPQ